MRSDPYLQRACELAVEAGLDPDSKVDRPNNPAPLWYLHVRGPDDIVPMRSYDEAIALTDWFTAVDRGNIANEMCPLFAAVPALWPWSAETHADALARRGERGSDYPLTLDPPRGDIVALTKLALDHPLCKIGKAARINPLPVGVGIENGRSQP